ncbi:MAG: hypothetical protein WDO13_20205 [Verrucomicrobiota bacterium]
MRIALLTLILTVSLAASAQARLGETPDELVARYGQPLNEADQKNEGVKVALANVTFQKGGFQIDVAITDGVSVAETFKKNQRRSDHRGRSAGFCSRPMRRAANGDRSSPLAATWSGCATTPRRRGSRMTAR